MRRISFHPSVQADVSEALSRYYEISQNLVDGFWEELTQAFQEALRSPESNHFDLIAADLRRVNLKRFPYNFLYLVEADRIRIQGVRQNSRRRGYGTRRLK